MDPCRCLAIRRLQGITSPEYLSVIMSTYVRMVRILWRGPRRAPRVHLPVRTGRHRACSGLHHSQHRSLLASLLLSPVDSPRDNQRDSLHRSPPGSPRAGRRLNQLDNLQHSHPEDLADVLAANPLLSLHRNQLQALLRLASLVHIRIATNATLRGMVSVDCFVKQWPSAEMYLSIIPLVVGTYVSGGSATSTQACSSAVYDGAARCQTAEGWLLCVFPLNSTHFFMFAAYVSSISGFASPVSVAADTLGQQFVVDNYAIKRVSSAGNQISICRACLMSVTSVHIFLNKFHLIWCRCCYRVSWSARNFHPC
jgi:hypothetical protein